jgi:hypothetical protein
MPEPDTSRYSRYPTWPIRTLPARDRLTVGQEYAPRIELVVGRDGYSGGISITAWAHDDAGVVRPKVLFKHRWQAKPESFEECLQVAYRGLSAYCEEACIPLG